MPLEKIMEFCTGCGACASACLHGAIDIRENKNGFLRPFIDKAVCNNCGMCEKICPLITAVPFAESQFSIPKVYAAYNLNEKIQVQSTSGGIFDILARAVLEEGGIVFGAAFEEDFSVSHKGVNSADGLEALRCSKYVQSHTKRTFTEVKEHLNLGRKVLYVGTPCMIGGLLGFLGKRSENLYACSLICGSVSSRKVWRLYTNYREEQAGEKLNKVCFRDKRFGWQCLTVSMSFGRSKNYMSKHDWFLHAYYRHFFPNDACLACSYRGVAQLADLMLADFWGIEEIRPRLAADQKGVSAILVNNKHGAELFDRCRDQMCREEAPLDLVVRRNGALTGCGSPYKKRGSLLGDLDHLTMGKIIKKYPSVKNLFFRAMKKAGKIVTRFIKL